MIGDNKKRERNYAPFTLVNFYIKFTRQTKRHAAENSSEEVAEQSTRGKKCDRRGCRRKMRQEEGKSLFTLPHAFEIRCPAVFVFPICMSSQRGLPQNCFVENLS